ncbi:MAG: PilZ domain-containing protein [Hyphomicrobium sp.]|nr:PilZ domain-containing protein [Hyphomicrobium sp.]
MSVYETAAQREPRSETVATLDLDYDERRWAQRKNSSAAALILGNGGPPDIPCILRDVSTTGARLELVEGPGNLIGGRVRLPAYFTLQMKFDRMEVDCAIVWRQSGMVGVRFTSTPRSLARRSR